MNSNEVIVTTRDKLMRAWENSMELAKDFEVYAKEEKGGVSERFKEFALEEGLHASELREMLLEDQRR